MNEIRLVERDYQIFREIDRWRVVLGRQLAELAGFTGLKACQRRLKKLKEAGYLERKRQLFGVPGIYSLTHMAKVIASLPERPEKQRIEQIPHDIAVLDTAIYFHKAKNIAYADITTEKQLHSIDGFGVRKHRPDFVINRADKTYCVEIELSLKAKARLESIIQANFMDYDHQIWIVPDKQCKIYQILKGSQSQYPNIHVLEIQEVKI
jgi:hypothetical protein